MNVEKKLTSTTPSGRKIFHYYVGDHKFRSAKQADSYLNGISKQAAIPAVKDLGLELRNIKVIKSRSEETLCFDARLFQHGRPFADVRNDGYGAPHLITPIGEFTHEDIRELDEMCKQTFPRIEKYDLEQDLELWISYKAEDHLRLQDLRRALKNKVLFVHPNKGIMQVSWRGVKNVNSSHFKKVRDSHGDVVILNELTEEQALELFKG